MGTTPHTHTVHIAVGGTPLTKVTAYLTELELYGLGPDEAAAVEDLLDEIELRLALPDEQRHAGLGEAAVTQFDRMRHCTRDELRRSFELVKG
jgi:hypothetical protein